MELHYSEASTFVVLHTLLTFCPLVTTPPVIKVIPGLLTQWSKMYQLSLFGSATQKLIAATVDGDLEHGVQFVGQSQGLIEDIPTVQELVDRCIAEAHERHTSVGTKLNAEA
jgi:NAD(P)H-dependent flavin oxidoreductase YrpB (nitropropane dioxygenase family)